MHATSQGFAVGMHAALQINPYYGKTSQAGLRTHFEASFVSALLLPAADHSCRTSPSTQYKH